MLAYPLARLSRQASIPANISFSLDEYSSYQDSNFEHNSDDFELLVSTPENMSFSLSPVVEDLPAAESDQTDVMPSRSSVLSASSTLDMSAIQPMTRFFAVDAVFVLFLLLMVSECISYYPRLAMTTRSYGTEQAFGLALCGLVYNQRFADSLIRRRKSRQGEIKVCTNIMRSDCGGAPLKLYL